MITPLQLEHAPFQPLFDLASTLDSTASAARTSAGTVADVATWGRGSSWSGDSADAASHRTQSAAHRVLSVGLASELAGMAASTYGHAIQWSREVVATVYGLARGAGFSIDQFGKISLSPWQMAAHLAAFANPVTLSIAVAVDEFIITLNGIVAGATAFANAADAIASVAFGKTIASQEEALAMGAAQSSKDATLPASVTGPVTQSTVNTPTGPISTVGEVEKADRIITLVSGVGSSNAESLRKNTIWAEQKVREAAARGEKLAVVAWHAYKAPPSVPLALSTLPAQAGGESLREFQDSLRARNSTARLEVVGHSYGSTVVGYAAKQDDFQADGIQLLGSPGTPLDPNDPRITVNRALGDPIELATYADHLFQGPLDDILGLGADPHQPNVFAEGWGHFFNAYLWATGEDDSHSSYLWDGGVIK